VYSWGVELTTVGIHSAGHMGAGLGWALRSGGCRVVTTASGRSDRTARLAAEAGLVVLPALDDVVREADVVLVVTPPGAARAAARDLKTAAARTRHDPLIVDLNAVSPSTVEDVAALLRPLSFVDGAVSGPPPTVRPGARLYFSGPRAADVTTLPWQHVTAIIVGDTIGKASALKMCTASVYKGLTGLYLQAMRAAGRYGVLDEVIADLATGGHPEPARSVTLAATKAARYAPEMREISATQRDAGLPAELFAAFAEVYGYLARAPLAAGDPESVDTTLSPAEVVSRLDS
jgi:3-hydroxyisobutyrate dehydrogenase-like beta-hydroxyacid dehydrogenase